MGGGLGITRMSCSGTGVVGARAAYSSAELAKKLQVCLGGPGHVGLEQGNSTRAGNDPMTWSGNFMTLLFTGISAAPF